MGSKLFRALLDPQPPLGAEGRLGRRDVPPQAHRRQRGGTGLGQRALVERDLQARVAHFRVQVLPMPRRQPPADVQAEPEQRRELRAGQAGVEVAGDVQERLLEDVRRVDPGPEPGLEAQLHHAPEPVAVLAERAPPKPRGRRREAERSGSAG